MTSTLGRPSSDRIAARAAAPSRAFWATAILGLILAQRFALDAGGSEVPLTLPLALVWLAFGLVRGHLRVKREAASAYGLACAVLVVLSLVALARGLPISLFSLVFLVFLYLPATALSTRTAGREIAWALDFYVKVMAGSAILGVTLFAGQFVGLPYRDWIFERLPSAILQGGYVTAYPLSYGSPIYRTNGLVFLEASFYSLFLGTALLIGIWRGASLGLLAVIAFAMAASASGNGIVVVTVGVLWLLASRYRALLRRLAPAALALALTVIATPLAELFTERSTEITSEDSSASLRLVQPYQETLTAYAQALPEMLLGHGAGSITIYFDETLGEVALIAPIPLKLLYEYGVIGLIAFGGFLWMALRRGAPSRPWTPGLLVAYFLLNEALLQPTIALTALLILGLLNDHEGGPGPAQIRPSGS